MTTRSRHTSWLMLPVYLLTTLLVGLLFQGAGLDPLGSIWTGAIWFLCWMALVTALRGLLWFALLLIKPELSDRLRS